LILSFHHALLGFVTDNLYAVAAWVSDDETKLKVVGYYFGDPIASGEWEHLSAAVTEVIADYSHLINLEERYVNVAQEPLPVDVGVSNLMFLRFVEEAPNSD